jgi:hypothetical protein
MTAQSSGRHNRQRHRLTDRASVVNKDPTPHEAGPRIASLYETRLQPPLTRAAFMRRMGGHLLVALGLLAVSLAAGMAGYAYFEHLAWPDAFLNSAMLLGGMGPVDAPKTEAGKLFAGIYALYAGLLFIFTTALLFTPIVHRLMHRFHWSEKLP